MLSNLDEFVDVMGSSRYWKNRDDHVYG